MMTRASALALFVAIALFSGICSGQEATGTPPFGSFGGGPDVVNLGDLNAHIAIPVIHKAGRGLPFSYDLSYDSSVWYPVSVSGNQTWTPVANWGWRGVTEAAVGYRSYNWQAVGCDPGLGRITHYIDYHDPAGSVHRFPTNWSTCDGPSPITVPASDGSGYVYYLSLTAEALYTRDGATIDTVANTIADRNGNVLSTSVNSGTTTITDTLGTTALTISGSGTQSNPMVYQYTGPSGLVSVTAHYTDLPPVFVHVRIRQLSAAPSWV